MEHGQNDYLWYSPRLQPRGRALGCYLNYYKDMSVEMFTDGLEPENKDAAIWRFMELWKFEDLVTKGELYFCRADLFPQDKNEGLPPEEYIRVLGFDPLDIHKINNLIGSIAQFREAFFINCWYLFSEETVQMWKEYGNNGVAICSRYNLLKAALDSCDGRPHLGLVRYGSKHLTGWNTMRFITTKRDEYKHEQEVRALLWIHDEYAGINRHFDKQNMPHPLPLTPPPSHVPKFQRRKVDLQSLITHVVVNPFASDRLLPDVERLIRDNGYSIPVRLSELAQYRHLLPY
jgi:hypothetical protein